MFNYYLKTVETERIKREDMSIYIFFMLIDLFYVFISINLIKYLFIHFYTCIFSPEALNKHAINLSQNPTVSLVFSFFFLCLEFVRKHFVVEFVFVSFMT